MAKALLSCYLTILTFFSTAIFLTTIILLIVASAVVELWWWSLLHNWLVTTKDRETFFYFFAAADIAQMPQCTIKVPCHRHHHHMIIIFPVPAWWDNIHPNLLTHNPLVPFGQICHCCLITIFVTDRTKTPGPHQIGLMKDKAETKFFFKSKSTWRTSVDDIISVGPFHFPVRLPNQSSTIPEIFANIPGGEKR